MTSSEMAAWIADFRTRAGSFPQGLAARRELGRRLFAGGGVPNGLHVSADEAAGVPAEWSWAASARADRVVLYLHGGGYASGSAAGVRPFARALSTATGAWIVSPDYRLAPEHPFPAAIEDALAWYDALLVRGRSADQILVAGASAGGGLAVGTLLAIRDSGRPRPAGAILASPWLDLTLSSSSMRTRECPEPLITFEESARFAAYYLAGQDPRHPWASPLFADLVGLPPIHVEVSSPERVYDEVDGFVHAAHEAAVEVTLAETAEAVHAFVFNASSTPEAAAAFDRIAERCERWFAPARDDR